MLVPLRMTVPVPALLCTVKEPDPAKDPEKVSVFPFVSIVEAPVMVPDLADVTFPVVNKVPLMKFNDPDESPKLLSAPMRNVPAPTVVPPKYVLLASRIKTPVPSFVKEPDPPIAVLSVLEPVVLILAAPVNVMALAVAKLPVNAKVPAPMETVLLAFPKRSAAMERMPPLMIVPPV